jgi:hypothetical protein
MIHSAMRDHLTSNFGLFFAGAIPIELGQLVNLEELNLSSNRLTGALG